MLGVFLTTSRGSLRHFTQINITSRNCERKENVKSLHMQKYRSPSTFKVLDELNDPEISLDSEWGHYSTRPLSPSGLLLRLSRALKVLRWAASCSAEHRGTSDPRALSLGPTAFHNRDRLAGKLVLSCSRSSHNDVPTSRSFIALSIATNLMGVYVSKAGVRHKGNCWD